MLDEQIHDAANADLFIVAEDGEPPGKLIGPLDLPRHVQSMPYIELFIEGYTEGPDMKFVKRDVMLWRQP